MVEKKEEKYAKRSRLISEIFVFIMGLILVLLGFFIAGWAGFILGFIIASIVGCFILPGGTAIKTVVQLITLTTILILVVVLSYFGFNCIQKGTCQFYISPIMDQITNSAFARIIPSSFAGIIDILKGNPPKPGTAFSWEEETIKVEEFGVKINSFKPDLSMYSINEPIEVIADINIKAPEDYDITINFDKSCTSLDNNFKPSTSKIYTVYANSEESLSVSCESLIGYTEKIFEGANKQQIITKKIIFSPYYSFAQEVSLNIMTKNKKLKEDEIIGKARSIKKGPMSLGLSSTNSQPFYTGDVNHIYLTIENNPLIWNGYLKKIKEIILYVPNSIELLSEDEEDSKFCDFEKESTEDNYKLYSLKSELISDINDLDCSKLDTLYDLLGSKQKCLDKAKENFRFTCKFEVIEAEEEASQIPPLKAKMEYDYGIQKVASVSIINPSQQVKS